VGRKIARKQTTTSPFLSPPVRLPPAEEEGKMFGDCQVLSSMAAMAGASSSADALFIPNPGALAGFMSSSAAAMPFHHFSTTTTSLIPVSITPSIPLLARSSCFFDPESEMARVFFSFYRRRRAAASWAR
jgi:hypothetical protein